MSYYIALDNRRHVKTLAGGLPSFDYLERFDSVADAAQAIYDRAHEIIDRDVTESQDMPPYDDESEANGNGPWNIEYRRRMDAVRAEIEEREGWDYDGVYYRIKEIDYRAPLCVVRVRNFFGPREEWTIEDDGFDCVADACKYIEDAKRGRYDLANGEASRPDYYVICERDKDWLENDDQGKFDWDGCECKQGDIEGDCCGYCDDCVNWMRDKELAYIREHAITED